MMMAINTAQLTIDDVFTTSRGFKTARIRDGDDDDCEFTPACKLKVPFAPSTFDKNPEATRLNLQLSIDDDATLRELKKFDAWVVEYIAQNSERLLRKKLTKEQVQAAYSSNLKTKEGYAPLLKTKLDLEGRNAVCCWGKDDSSIDAPASLDAWKGYIEARICFTHVWIMGTQFGVVARLTDAKFVGDDESSRPQRKSPFKKM